jgi:CubicO group peptidase (beta-lactamase class C family)
MTAALAAQRPAWKPGTAHGYHGRTFGWLVGEIIRRVSGRSVGAFFAEEIAAPARLDFFIGIPPAERAGVSQMIIDDPPGPEVADIPLDQIPEQFRELVAAFTDPMSLLNRAFALSVPDIDFNDPEVQAAEIPSSNGICTADGLARLYAGLIGEVDGVRILDAATITAAVAEQAAGTDRVLLVPSRYASGFMLPTQEAPLGGPSSFGHPGRGGSLGFADPESGIAFGYVVNHIRQDLNDTRAATLVAAVQACLG